ncbi:MAG: lipid A biosynthesis acyltransferase [Candidatus Parabeggiatoa sp. nov. 3]|nr:MAG: lipid A biosynthesis acyltransferase [Gammaproteobacteria bacterium]RKZ64774.1 MAG: lipid A biosynthesis acyltransferase [Gammaproteobacteria bacterium]RKZ86566.1 MAG: lipid A biosynthesis acyltransferase [Gammaproteobacteria bacterium]
MIDFARNAIGKLKAKSWCARAVYISKKAPSESVNTLKESTKSKILKGLLHLLALLPPVHRIATLLGRIAAHYPQLSITQVTRINIQLCFPQLSNEEQTRLVKQNLIETGKTFSELGALWLWPKDRVLGLVRQVSGEACLQEALQRGKGVVLLTPHLGAWEMAGLYASNHYPLTALYRPPKLSGLQDLIHSARERAGGRFVPTDKTGVRALYRALHQGQIAGILPDQVPNEAGSGIFAPFFGIPAYTMVLVSRLARKTGATVIFTYAERLPQGFHIHFLPAPVDIAADNLEIAVRALNQGIEHCIQHCPTQYQWSYKRFKRRPEGEKAVY